jgi:hypothetical protein
MNQWNIVNEQPAILYGRYIVPNFASNSICIKGSEGDVCVISPGESLLKDFSDRFSELDKDAGTNLTLVAPNAYHFMGLDAWRKRYPRANVYSSESAVKSLAKKGVGDIQTLSEGSSDLLDGSFWVCPPGHRGGDIWFVYPIKNGWGWVTCDSFLNYPRLSNQPVARAIQKIMGAAPGLKLSAVIKYLLLTDRSGFKKWMKDFVRTYPPVSLIPSHGDPSFSEDLANQLELLVESRL